MRNIYRNKTTNGQDDHGEGGILGVTVIVFECFLGYLLTYFIVLFFNYLFLLI